MNKMMMAALAATLAFATPAIANDAHHPENAQAVKNTPVKSESNMPAQTVNKMQENVRKIPSQIDRIVNAKTDEERKKAMLEHMQSMQQNMKMIGSMQSGMMACPLMEGSMGMGMMGGAQLGRQSDASAERMQQMESRLNRMQMMIEQMAPRQESQPTMSAK